MRLYDYRLVNGKCDHRLLSIFRIKIYNTYTYVAYATNMEKWFFFVFSYIQEISCLFTKDKKCMYIGGERERVIFILPGSSAGI